MTGVRQRLSGLFILQIFVLPKFLSEFGCILYYKIYVAWYNGILCNSWIRLTNLYVKIPLFISWTLSVCLFNVLDIPVLNPSPFHFQDLVSNSPYCVLYNFYYYELGEFGIRSTNHLLIDVFLHSHHLSAWYCIDIVMRKSVLVTNKGWKFKI